MKTDPISAATHYRQALRAILKCTTAQETRKIAASVLEITFTPAEEGHISVDGGYGSNTKRPFVTLGIANPTESANPIVQLSIDQAREIAMQLLGAADRAISDGFVLTWLGEAVTELNEEQAGVLLADFRAYRDRLRGAQGGAE
jgi:hypothetical protein